MKLVLDACVLYPTVLREILMKTAQAGLFQPRWSDRLFEEWARAAARNGGPVDEMVARGEIIRLKAHVPQAMVARNEATEARLWLPDAHDIHVLATAVDAGAEAIVTLNLRDFPTRELATHGLRAIHPDALLMELWMAHPDAVAEAVRETHATAEHIAEDSLPLRALLKRARLPRLGKALA